MWYNKKILKEKVNYLNLLSGDLRISITNVCNMKCTYCHNEGVQSQYSELSLNDVIYIINESKKYGVKSVRITGGEPLIHKDVFEIFKSVKTNHPDLQLGINTNAIEIDILLKIINKKYIDRAVVGIDYFDSNVSKNSLIGSSSSAILENILKIKNAGCRVDLSTVYNDEMGHINKLIKWCFKNRIRIKILEHITGEVDTTPSQPYIEMMKRMIQNYNLQLGFDVTRKQYFATSVDGNVVSFFHSHCRIRECDICTRLHLRISSQGKTKSCLFGNTPEFSLLYGNFDENFLLGLSFLGVSPKNEAIRGEKN
ncbi:MAG: radical SAM protein [Endomicrobium sp.]|jgi:cyclic pyranopterin phosphate synthase|nr:radical SAM protein [Endomicrobium sp.]